MLRRRIVYDTYSQPASQSASQSKDYIASYFQIVYSSILASFITTPYHGCVAPFVYVQSFKFKRAFVWIVYEGDDATLRYDARDHPLFYWNVYQTHPISLFIRRDATDVYLK